MTDEVITSNEVLESVVENVVATDSVQTPPVATSLPAKRTGIAVEPVFSPPLAGSSAPKRKGFAVDAILSPLVGDSSAPKRKGIAVDAILIADSSEPKRKGMDVEGLAPKRKKKLAEQAAEAAAAVTGIQETVVPSPKGKRKKVSDMLVVNIGNHPLTGQRCVQITQWDDSIYIDTRYVADVIVPLVNYAVEINRLGSAE